MQFKSAATTVLMAILFASTASSSTLLPRVDHGKCTTTSEDTCNGDGMCHLTTGQAICCGPNHKGRACGKTNNDCKKLWFLGDKVNCD